MWCGGCEQTIQVDTGVKLDKSLERDNQLPPVRVHVVGANAADLKRYTECPVDKWFAPDDDTRKGAEDLGIVKELQFGPGKDNPQTLTRNDAIWKKWDARGVEKLVIFITCVRRTARRPIRGCTFCRCSVINGSSKAIDLTVRRSGIDVVPPFKPESK